ncbi:MAG: 5-formyltetrahydrofolate cyclo-ligase [Phycisphaeraceae bacterium]|nr:5-formyltetrahydrofolate cyclo-ligase [Phycisphaeraceae bacterium]MBX3405436.1 5-formyltetrahydrofolate cyclo-ligase [Phycisphaeraceae bacterium]
MTDTADAKQLLRAQLRARLATVTPELAAAWSEQACQRIESAPAFGAARAVMLFVPMSARAEVDLRPLATRARHAGKTIALPRVDWQSRTLSPRIVRDLADDLEPDTAARGAAAGLLHPRERCPAINPANLELVLVPGLGFDSEGGRIGHGAGFYDRFLAHPALRAAAWGVGFECQVLPAAGRLPREPHDRSLDALVTESRLMMFGSGQAEPRGGG